MDSDSFSNGLQVLYVPLFTNREASSFYQHSMVTSIPELASFCQHSSMVAFQGEEHLIKFSQIQTRSQIIITKNTATKSTHQSSTTMDPDSLSKAFVEHYYSTFDTDCASLSSLYQDSSMLTFEGEKIKGAVNIVAKLTSLPFQQCKHNITTVDCQPSGPAGGMLIFVSGTMQLAGEEHLHKFSQMFHLMPTQQGSFYVFNDIFRLNYA